MRVGTNPWTKVITIELEQEDALAIIEACGALAGILDRDEEASKFYGSSQQQLEEIAYKVREQIANE